MIHIIYAGVFHFNDFHVEAVIECPGELNVEALLLDYEKSFETPALASAFVQHLIRDCGCQKIDYEEHYTQ